MFWKKKNQVTAKDNTYNILKKYLDEKGDSKTICALYLKIFREEYKLNLTIKSINISGDPFLLTFQFNEKIEMNSSLWNLFKNSIEPNLKHRIPGYTQFLARTDDNSCDKFVIHVEIDFDGMERNLREIQDMYNKASPAEKARMDKRFRDIGKRQK